MQADDATSAGPFCDRELVGRLHQAYADKTESQFRGLARIPGDPFGVCIRSFGSTRTHIARRYDWQNRATLVGDENAERVDAVVRHFDEQGRRCHVEWNPGNCYQPGSWNDDLGRLLLDRGFRPLGFRCVWAIKPSTATAATEPAGLDLRHYGPDDLDGYVDAVAVIEGHTDRQRADKAAETRYAESGAAWRHYAGFVGGTAACEAKLFVSGSTGYLDWGTTTPAYRGRGFHAALIRRRLADAHAAGCDLAFSVTDVGVPSSRNLQRAGFRLAYNYVMLVREPEHTEGVVQ